MVWCITLHIGDTLQANCQAGLWVLTVKIYFSPNQTFFALLFQFFGAGRQQMQLDEHMPAVVVVRTKKSTQLDCSIENLFLSRGHDSVLLLHVYHT